MKPNAHFFDFKKNSREAALSFAVAASLFLAGMASYALAAAQNTTLSVAVNAALTFAVTTNNFPNINPGTPQMATTTLLVTTNDNAGYFVSLSGTNKATGHNNLQTAGDAAEITDQTEWIPGTATTTAGNAVRLASLANGGNVLAFRVMSASSTNGTKLLAPTWWGSQDNYADNANTLWAGIASSTVQRVIGNSSGPYVSATQINTVLYYLNVGATQQTGTYSAPITYTATGN